MVWLLPPHTTMLLEVREISPKTVRDGRQEITIETFRRLSPFGERLPVLVNNERGEGVLTSMRCSCAKGGDAQGHEHYFLQCPLFGALPAGMTVVLELLEGPVVSMATPHDLRPA